MAASTPSSVGGRRTRCRAANGRAAVRTWRRRMPPVWAGVVWARRDDPGCLARGRARRDVCGNSACPAASLTPAGACPGLSFRFSPRILTLWSAPELPPSPVRSLPGISRRRRGSRPRDGRRRASCAGWSCSTCTAATESSNAGSLPPSTWRRTKRAWSSWWTRAGVLRARTGGSSATGRLSLKGNVLERSPGRVSSPHPRLSAFAAISRFFQGRWTRCGWTGSAWKPSLRPPSAVGVPPTPWALFWASVRLRSFPAVITQHCRTASIGVVWARMSTRRVLQPPRIRGEEGMRCSRYRWQHRYRGKSGLHRAGCWGNPSRGDSQASATESKPPSQLRR